MIQELSKHMLLASVVSQEKVVDVNLDDDVGTNYSGGLV